MKAGLRSVVVVLLCVGCFGAFFKAGLVTWRILFQSQADQKENAEVEMMEVSESGLPWGQCRWCGKVVKYSDTSQGAFYVSGAGSILGFLCNEDCYWKWKEKEKERKKEISGKQVEYSNGFNQALEAIMLLDLELKLGGERKTWEEMADICRERFGVLKPVR